MAHFRSAGPIPPPAGELEPTSWRGSGSIVRHHEVVHPSRILVLSASADVVLVAVFVLIGRRSHNETDAVGGFLTTFWPFLTGLAVGWLASRAWRAPVGIRRSGLTVWLATVAIGMLLRVLSRQGIAVSFVIVAAIVLGVCLLGWRGIAVGLVRRRASARA